MAKKKITDIVGEIFADYPEKDKYVLYNTEFVKEGRDWFLRVYIDFADYGRTENEENVRHIGTEDCEKVSRYISEKLDEVDPVEQNYFLEVSSPGMDRPLIKREHFKRYIGSPVEIKLYKGIDGTKLIEGVLTSYEQDGVSQDYDTVIIKSDDREWTLKKKDIAKAQLAVIF